MSEEGLRITYRTLTNDERKDVITLMSEHYMPHEPVSKALSLSQDEMKAYAKGLTMITLPHHASIGAFDGGFLCGVAMNSIGQDAVTTEEQIAFNQMPLKAQYLTRFDTFVEAQGSSLIPNIAKCLFHDSLVVHEKYSKKGIGTELTRRSLDLAVARGCERTISFATSYKSLLIDAHLGFEKLKKICITDYEDSVTKEKLFKETNLPENCIHVMSMDLKKYVSKL